MEISNYHKCLIEYGMINDRFSQVSSDIFFCKGNKTKSINFERFCGILIEIAGSMFPETAQKQVAIENFMRETIFNKADKVVEIQEFKEWLVEVESEEVQKIQNYYKSAMAKIFRKGSHGAKRVELCDYLRLCKERKIIPDLLSNQDCSKVYKEYLGSLEAVDQMISFEQYVECNCLLALFYYQKVAPSACFKYSEKIRKFLSCLVHAQTG